MPSSACSPVADDLSFLLVFVNDEFFGVDSIESQTPGADVIRVEPASDVSVFVREKECIAFLPRVEGHSVTATLL